MSDISTLLPQESETVLAIYKWHEDEEAKREGPHNGRLGASIIGHNCDRYLWYTFRQCFKSKFEGRMLRLFRTGHLEEDRFIEELRGIGCEVKAIDPETNKQYEVTAIGGHFVSHPDGYVYKLPEAPRTWHVAEMKTMGGEENQSKDFEKVKAKGVELAKPMHFIQMQINMFLSEMKRAIYMCKKKSTDHIHTERIKLVGSIVKKYMERAERIITAQQPPERMSDRPDYYECGYCDARDICWAAEDSHIIPIPAKTCRTCLHATPVLDGYAKWTCAWHGRDISFEQQLKGCEHHLFIPALVHFAEVADAGKDWVEYKNKNDGAIWRNGNGSEGSFTSDALISSGLVADNSFDIPDLSLVDQYAHNFTERLWNGKPEDSAQALKDFGYYDSMAQKAPDNQEETDEYFAAEFKLEFEDLLIVTYKKENVTVIWRGAK